MTTEEQPEAGPSRHTSPAQIQDEREEENSSSTSVDGLDPEGFAGPVVKPLTPEALAAFKAAQELAGVIYISRIPPGMRPTKVRHLMSAYGEVGRVYLQQEGMPSLHFQTCPCWRPLCRCKTRISQTEVHCDEESTFH